MTNDELLHKWIDKSITAKELEVFKLRPEYDFLVDLYLNTEGFETPQFDSDQMLTAILKTEKGTDVGQSQPSNLLKKRSKLLRSFIKYAAAACLLIVAGFWFVSADDIVDYNIAEEAELREFFPDKSSFVLYENSHLSYNKDIWSKERNVRLKGKAFFKVEKGEPFTVETDLGSVMVLGTEFDINTENEKLLVMCKSGKVAVYSVKSDNYSEVLVAGESMELELSGTSKTYKRDITKLRKVVLADLKKALTSQYDLEFLSDSIISNDRFSCNFQHRDIDLALKTSLSPLSINYRVSEDNTIQLIN